MARATAIQQAEFVQRSRKQLARDIRIAATQWASRDNGNAMQQPLFNSEETRFRAQNYLTGFTKGLAHDAASGLLTRPEDYEQRVRYIQRVAQATPLIFLGDAEQELPNASRPARTLLEGIHDIGGFALTGRDCHSYVIAPAPALGSAQLASEMAALYTQAQLRDVALSRFAVIETAATQLADCAADDDDAALIDNSLQKLQLLAPGGTQLSFTRQFVTQQLVTQQFVTQQSATRQSFTQQSLLTDAPFSAQAMTLACGAFRGFTAGDDVGPYVSQFLLAGSRAGGSQDAAAKGLVCVGGHCVDQRMPAALRRDYVTTWAEWLAAQQGFSSGNADAIHATRWDATRRFIATPRDLARHAHSNSAVMAFNTALHLLLSCDEKQTHFDVGDLNLILMLMASASHQAMRAARYQQYCVHRRLRPEALAARLEKYDHPDVSCDEISDLFSDLARARIFDDSGNLENRRNRLLPQAWPNGAPNAPAYCSALAASAGACATILKAFYRGNNQLDVTGMGSAFGFVASHDGSHLITCALAQPLAVEHEINKLASNLAVGRCWAGVNFRSDVVAGLHLGEAVALDVLEEQRMLQTRYARRQFTRFDGDVASV